MLCWLRQAFNRLYVYRRQLCYVVLGLQSAMFVFLLTLSKYMWNNIPDISVPNLTMECLGIFVLLLIFGSIVRSGLNNRINVLFLVVVALDVLYLFSDAVFWLIDGIPSLHFANLLINTIYCVCPVSMAFVYWYIMCEWLEDDPEQFAFSTKTINLVSVVNIGCLIGNIWGGYYFSVSPQTGQYQRGPAYVFFLFLPFVLLLVSFFHILKKDLPHSDKVILMIYPLLPYISTFEALYHVGPTLLPIGTFCSLVFLYSNLYVRREKELIHRQQELTQSQLNAMLLQINPHFILNTLGSIDSLCVENPTEAQSLLRLFSRHLRNNFLDTVSEPLVPFKMELEHLQNYLSIEQVRFPRLNVVYDIKAENFNIPSMSVQPLAENAVRHGICKRRKSEGTLTVSSWETDDAYLICVVDDGVGFSEHLKEDNESHIGIENVRKRLELICGGSLAIHSAPNEGTKCLITLPKRKDVRI